MSTRYDPLRTFKIGLTALLMVAIVSTVVYFLLGLYYGTHWHILDCLFMVVITMTTVGYDDWLGIRDKPLALMYTMGLALLGIGIPAFLISNVTALVVDGILHDTFRRRRMQQEIAALNRHIVVCGAGDTGEHCIEELLKLQRKFVVIDQSEDRLKEIEDKLGAFPYIVGHADNDQTLKQAGVERAEGLLCCLPEDKDNLFITISARLLNPDVRICSKGIQDHIRQKMTIAGANAVVSPTEIGGLRLVSELIRPVTVNFLDGMLRDKSAVRFGELVMGPTSALNGKTLAEADLRGIADLLVVAARHPGVETFVYNPKADFRLDADCVIVVLGAAGEIDKLKPLFK